jgi:hypothetical protein
MSISALCGCLLALALLPCASEAATPTAAHQAAVQPLSAGDGKSAATPTYLSAATLEAGTSDTKATLSAVGFVPQNLAPDLYLQYQVHGEAPLSSKDSNNEVDIGTVSGLTAGASATGDFSVMRWPYASVDPMTDLDPVCQEALPRMIKPNAAAGEDYRYEEIETWSDVAEPCSRSVFATGGLQKLVDGLNAHFDRCNKVDLAASNLKPGEKIACAKLKKNQGAKLDSQNSIVTEALKKVDAYEKVAAAPIQIFTFGGTVNRDKASYFSQNNLATLVKTHTTGYGAHAAYSLVLPNTVMYSLGFSYERTFKNGDSLQICSPISGSTSSKCQQGSIGAPQGKFSRIVFAESRILLSLNHFALSPRMEYDFTASRFAARLPIYLVPNKDKLLTGGVTLGYVTHGDGFGAAIFVNKAFSFF